MKTLTQTMEEYHAFLDLILKKASKTSDPGLNERVKKLEDKVEKFVKNYETKIKI